MMICMEKRKHANTWEADGAAHARGLANEVSKMIACR
jgi:hypothetical protein